MGTPPDSPPPLRAVSAQRYHSADDELYYSGRQGYAPVAHTDYGSLNPRIHSGGPRRAAARVPPPAPARTCHPIQNSSGWGDDAAPLPPMRQDDVRFRGGIQRGAVAARDGSDERGYLSFGDEYSGRNFEERPDYNNR